MMWNIWSCWNFPNPVSSGFAGATRQRTERGSSVVHHPADPKMLTYSLIEQSVYIHRNVKDNRVCDELTTLTTLTPAAPDSGVITPPAAVPSSSELSATANAGAVNG